MLTYILYISVVLFNFILFIYIILRNNCNLICYILHIHWQDKVPDTDVLKQADLPSAIPHARRPHSKAALLWGTLLWKAYSWRAAKSLQGQFDSLPKRLQHQHWVLGVSCLWQTLLAPTHHQRSPRSWGTQVPSSWGEASSTALHVGKASLPGLVSSATSGHTVAIYQETRCLWSSSITKDEQQQFVIYTV